MPVGTGRRTEKFHNIVMKFRDVVLKFHCVVLKFCNVDLCFVSVLSRRQKISALVCLALDERFTIAFSHVRSPLPVTRGRRKGLEDKTYPAMDLLVHGEFNGARFTLVEDYIRML